MYIFIVSQIFSPALHVRNTQKHPSDVPLTIQGGGRLLLGQSLQENTEWHSLRGEIAELQIYNSSLSRDELQEYVACRQMNTVSKPLLSFQDMTDFTINDKAMFRSASRDAVCERKPFRLSLITTRYTFENSLKVCNLFGGNLTSFTSAEEMESIKKQFSEFRQQCATPRDTFYWVGVHFDHATGTWLDVSTQSPVPALGSSDGAAPPTFSCVTGGSEHSPSSWQVTSCDGLSCPLCNVTRINTALLRGLCKDSLFDRSYTAYGYHNGKPAFEGLQSSRLVWDNTTWVLSTRLSRRATARVNSSLSRRSLPFGLNSWIIDGDGCSQGKVSHQMGRYCQREKREWERG